MSDETEAGAPEAGTGARGRRLMLGLLTAVGGLALLLWSFVLPVLGIVHVVEMLS